MPRTSALVPVLELPPENVTKAEKAGLFQEDHEEVEVFTCHYGWIPKEYHRFCGTARTDGFGQ